MAFEEAPPYGLADPPSLEKIDRFLASGVGDLISLPQTIVVRDQSSSKSSVLDGLIRKPLPRDSGLCTRFNNTKLSSNGRPKRLRIANILENVAQIRHSIIEVAVGGQSWKEFYDGDGAVPDETLQMHLESTPLGRCTWIYYGTNSGPKQIRRYKLDIILKEFMKVPGVKGIKPIDLPKDQHFWSRDRIGSGEPDFEEFSYLNWIPNGAHLGFSPISPTCGPDALKLWKITKDGHRKHGIDLFLAFGVGLSKIHTIVLVIWDRDAPKRRKSVDMCMREMIDKCAKEGYGEYRTHILFQDQVAATYGWNDRALMKLDEKLKDALDPKGITAPGRCGIWPARYRGRGWEIGKEGRDTSEQWWEDSTPRLISLGGCKGSNPN